MQSMSNMKRRSFFRSLLGAAASIALSQRIVREDAKWILEAESSKVELNPAWVDAEYEIEFYAHPDVFYPYPAQLL